ncbi:FAD-dependent oxidoreductase [Afipia sp. GAS231]|uniref:FAD-dependent oxidoreductase n=1 Tax=Afipia sp. GAS231 TaxID=1882747 RepID=UPI00087D4116|nr:FAD-dependent oxidoreductase [Afipia sp. GAS231]SDP32371.1 3-(3-hydroxy-phenyl)propionate hydroxylase [Afipia sp. GAS231]
MRVREHEIVIVGGGPTGLMLAGELALAGVDVAVIERRPTKALAGSRAGGLHARSLEVLDQRGIVERFLAEGQTYPKVGFHVSLDISDFPTRHNYLLALRQERIERLLADWVEELNVPIHRGSDVLGIVHDDDGVDAAMTQGVNLRAGWLVGCDGGRSTVRKSAGIAFPGWEASTSWLIADVKMTEKPELGFREDSSGRHAMALREDGETVGVVIAGQDPRATCVPSLHDLAGALKAIYGTDFGVHAPTWMSRFSDAARQAAAYRNGRVLLAGDAAHIHSPMGGQGLNLGIQDAVNLGWKLAQVAKRTSPPSLLDTYQAERHPVAARVLRTTMAQGVLRYPGERTAILGEFVSELLAMQEPRKRFVAMMSGLDIRYSAGEGHPLLGRRMPDLDIVTAGRPARVFTLLHEARPVLLNLGKSGSLAIDGWSDRVKLVDARFEGGFELPVIGVVETPAAVLIRPDGHVAWVGDGGSKGLLDALGTWFGGLARPADLLTRPPA